ALCDASRQRIGAETHGRGHLATSAPAPGGLFLRPDQRREMIVKSSEADRFIGRAPKDLAAALFFGPDQGMVRERAEALARTIVPDLSDAFRVAELSEQALNADGARLADEAAAISMLGGRRVVRVRGAGNGLAKLFEEFLEEPKGDALVVVEAG